MFSLLTKYFPISRIQRTSYREDINSLRAYAVLGVVIYHAKFGIFESGYLGVDVFFVKRLSEKIVKLKKPIKNNNEIPTITIL